MSEARFHPLEAILRMCAQSAPHPWHYRVYAKETGVEPEQLVALLEMLWLEGLVQKAPASREFGPGVTVTELGRKVLDDPELVRRLCAGEPVRENDVGSTVRQSLRQQTRPWVTQLIVLANVIVFVIGAMIAAKKPGLLSAYLVGLRVEQAQIQPITDLWHQLGSVSTTDLVKGEWWRFLSATFVHAGVIHLGMNMYGLWVLGSFVERKWGSWRFLSIYFLAAWGGSCLAMSYSSGLVGASGAVCGVLAAEGMWVLLYGKYLPGNMARAGRSQMITNVVLIVFISMMPNVSWQGHLGGAIAGCAAALILHFQRFGPAVFRVLGVLALLPLPWASYAWMERARATNKTWLKAEMNTFEATLLPAIGKATRRANNVYNESVKPLEERRASRRDEVETQSALTSLSECIADLKAVNERLRQSGPYRDKEIETARTTALEYVNALIEACEESSRCLRDRTEWKQAQRKALEEKWEKVKEYRKAWQDLLD